MNIIEIYEKVMDYIDEHIIEDDDKIKLGFSKLIGITSSSFNTFFRFAVGVTVSNYIRKRRLYYAYNELIYNNTSIADIAQKYGYNDQPAFTNAFRAEYDITPNNVRIARIPCNNNRIKLDEAILPYLKKKESMLKSFIREFDKGGMAMGFKLQYMNTFERMLDEYPFDTDTAFMIAELAERIDIPMENLFDACLDIHADVHKESDYFGPLDEFLISLGISSRNEAKEICRFHNCELYELDRFSVSAYRKKLDLQTYLILRFNYNYADMEMTDDVISDYHNRKLKLNKDKR